MTTITHVAEAGLKQLLKALPLPIAQPVVLVRGKGPITDTELKGRLAIITSLQDELDVAIATRLWSEGASVCILDRKPNPTHLRVLERPGVAGATLSTIPTDLGNGESVSDAMASTRAADDRSPRMIIHRFDVEAVANVKDAPAAIEAALDQLYTIGHAAANSLPFNSRVIFVLPSPSRAQCHNPSVQVARAAIQGFMRSLSKELGRKGTTVHVLDENGATPDEVAGVVAYFAGPRSAYLDAVALTLTGSGGGVPTAYQPGVGAERETLAGKVAVVTGGGRGIGAAICEQLAREGAAVMVNDLAQGESAAARVLARLRDQGHKVAFCAADVATPEGAQKLADATKAAFGHADIIVNNAGITRDRTIKKMDFERWQLAVRVNLIAQLYVTEALLPIMRDGGRIVNLSSVAGIAGNFGQTNYSAAKAGVVGFTANAAERLRERNIAVNAMAPGFIRTRLTDRMPFINREMAKQLTALIQAGEPSDMADVVVFLAGPDGGAVNGCVIRADGGMAVGA